MSRKEEFERLKHLAWPGYLPVEERIAMFRMLKLARTLEEELVVERLQPTADIAGPPFDSRGQESISVGVTWALQENDVRAFSHRDAGGHLVSGVRPEQIWMQWMARKDGPSAGRDLNWHFGYGNALRFISHMASLCPMLTGAVYAKNYLLELEGKLTDRSRVVGVVFFGDGSMAQPVVHSTMNAAAVMNLPVVFIINDNSHAISTQPHESHPFPGMLDSLAVRGLAYNMPGKEITNGWDTAEVFYRAKFAVERARMGYGPSLLVFKTFRHEGHNRTENSDYMIKNPVRNDAKEFFVERDPVDFMRFTLRAHLSDAEVEAIDDEVRREVEESREVARKAPRPEACDEDLGSPYRDPLCEISSLLAEQNPPQPTERRLSYGLALNEALKLSMEKDPRVLTFGEDVRSGALTGGRGGVYGITRGLTELFGESRAWNTPISEDWLVGFAAGLAWVGLNPVAEIQFMPFADVGWSQMVSIIATHFWQTGTSLPMVIRMPGGYIPTSGHYHSSLTEVGLCNTPGLKIVCPADAFEAKALLLSAIKDPDPVIFMEQIRAYYRDKEPESYAALVPEGVYYLPLGKAQVRRVGTDLSIITYGAMMVNHAERAAEELAQEGISLEIINLRTLRPLDKETILASWQKTGRAIVLHEATKFAGFGAELVAILAGPEGYARSRWPENVKNPPVLRLAAKETPVPGSQALEDWRLVETSVAYIVEAAKMLMEYPAEPEMFEAMPPTSATSKIMGRK